MRDLGTPVLPKKFFANILKYFPQESGIFIVEVGGKDIGAGFTLSHKGIIEIPWASSLREYSKLCINEFMYWEIIKHGISTGMKKFDFGRCTKNSGTYRFKKQWNPEEKQLYWQYWAKGSKAVLINMWKRLPLFVANSLGPVVARDITTF
jgi:serine/alanine adding enzyme